jgi:hypothetical protein
MVCVFICIHSIGPDGVENDQVEHGCTAWIFNEEVQTGLFTILSLHVCHDTLPPHA